MCISALKHRESFFFASVYKVSYLTPCSLDLTNSAIADTVVQDQTLQNVQSNQ